MEKVRSEIMPGVWLTALRTDKFKTACLSVNLLTQLCRENASQNALIPFVLRRGTAKHPDMLRNASISFPMLGNLTINPRAYFTVFGHDIYWYGVILATAFLVGLLYCAHNAGRFGLKQDDIYEEVLWMVPLGVIGCRVYYVLFEWGYYSQHLNEIWRIRDGGIAMLRIPNMYCSTGSLMSVTGSRLGRPLSSQYSGSTRS